MAVNKGPAKKPPGGAPNPPPKAKPASPGTQTGPVRDDPASPGAAVLIALKAVPGSSRDQIAGLLGDRLKVRVAAPPEDGKANAALCKLVAAALGLPARQVEVVSGHSRPEKTLRAAGITRDAAVAALGLK